MGYCDWVGRSGGMEVVAAKTAGVTTCAATAVDEGEVTRFRSSEVNRVTP
jgi:hypothetical protein